MRARLAASLLVILGVLYASGCAGDDTLVDDDALDDDDACVSTEEIWYDGIDQDCDGGSDYDQDGDGFDAFGYQGDDCNDIDDAIHPGPGSAEACDGIDTNCDGVIAEDELDWDRDGWAECEGDCDDSDPLLSPLDADGDGWSICDGDCDDSDGSLTFDDVDADGWSTCDGDCDDSNQSVSPEADEVCNALDDDCDGLDDDGFDEDADGVWAATDACEATYGSPLDCDDNDDTVYPEYDGEPAAEELCDGLDNDCNGLVDDGPTITEEVCDGLDNDCNGLVDDTPFENGGFEGGASHWTDTGGSSFQVDGSLPGHAGTEAPEGNSMGWSSVEAPTSAYHQWAHVFCPAPGVPVTVTFKWQVVSMNSGPCTELGSNWLNLRIDTEEQNLEQWSVGWSEVCPLLADSATGWQEASVTFTAPMTSSPGTEALAFSIGGYSYDAWYGLVDDVQVSQ